MTTHPGYPPDHHSVQECRKLGLCWHDQENDADGEFEGYPICSACRAKYTVEA